MWDVCARRKIWGLTNVEYSRVRTAMTFSRKSNSLIYLDRDNAITTLNADNLREEKFIKHSEETPRNIYSVSSNKVLLQTMDGIYVASESNSTKLHTIDPTVAYCYVSISPSGKRCCVTSFKPLDKKTYIDIYSLED